MAQRGHTVVLPLHRTAGGFDHASAHGGLDRFYLAHTVSDCVEVIDLPEVATMNPTTPIGGPTKPHFNLSEALEFRTNAFVRKRLFQTESLHFNVYCIVPGQENPLHRHPLSDEILYFVSGAGECVVGDDVYPVEPGDFVLAPKDAPHAVRNTGEENLVCILVQSPLPCEHVAVR